MKKSFMPPKFICLAGYIIATIIIICSVASCEKEKSSPKQIIDADGNIYTAINIGHQQWLVENIHTSSYRNGDPIEFVTLDSQWVQISQGAYCVYRNDSNFLNPFGYLYNWKAISDSRGIAPEGWRIAGDEDWNELINYLGGADIAGGRIKQAGVQYWMIPNQIDSFKTNFNALPGGLRLNNGSFNYQSERGLWWSKTDIDSINASAFALYHYAKRIDRFIYNKKGGMSVRCVKWRWE